jgi:hypothetical protein
MIGLLSAESGEYAEDNRSEIRRHMFGLWLLVQGNLTGCRGA